MAASCESLIIWLNTLEYPEPIKSVQDLSNGVILSRILKTICPENFNDERQMRIKGDVSNNWRIKASNLKKVLKGILDFYSHELLLSLSESQIPDVNLIAEKEDRKEMCKLLQLVLGCAVNCDHKEDYIQKIMALEENVQHSVMISIKELMLTEFPHATESDSSQASLYVGEHKQLMDERNSHEQRCHELDQQLLILTEEMQSLKAENEKLNQRLNQVDILEDPRHWRDWDDHFGSTPLGRRLQQLQKQVDHLQEELFKSEAGKDDYRIRCEILEKDIKQLQAKNETLSKTTDDARVMKDELDVLRHNSDKVAKYEVMITNLRKKLEDLSDLKSQVKLFEEKNSSYVEKNLVLEEELKKTSLYKGQLEIYKRQAQDLQIKNSEENKRADKYQFELLRCHEKIVGLQMEKERLIEERDALKETNEDLKLMQVSVTVPSQDGEEDELEFFGMHPFIKEKVMKLQYELKMLKSTSCAMPEEVELFKNLLDDTSNRKDELEIELRTQNRKILELEARVDDLNEINRILMLNTNSASSPTLLPLNKSVEKTNEAQEVEMSQQLSEVSMKLLEKEHEMKLMEDKYKQYLEKAKILINHHQQRGLLLPAIVDERLSEKDELIKVLENKLKSYEAEEKLMMSAFYNMSIGLHKRNVEERISKGCSAMPHSFLSRQRQVQSRRVSSGVPASPHVR